MHRNILFLLFLLTASLPARSQSSCGCTLEGNVTSKENKESIPGAYVYIKGTNKFAQSDSKGHFRISALCPGSYTLICQMSSFNSVEIPILIKDEENHHENFSLADHDEHLQEVIVSGRKTETSAQLRGSLSKEERAERDGLSLGEMMRGISGVQSLQTGSLSLAYAIMSLQVMVPVFLSVLFFGEKMDISKGSALVLSIVSTYLMR